MIAHLKFACNNEIAPSGFEALVLLDSLRYAGVVVIVKMETSPSLLAFLNVGLGKFIWVYVAISSETAESKAFKEFAFDAATVHAPFEISFSMQQLTPRGIFHHAVDVMKATPII